MTPHPENLIAWMDGELDAETASTVEEHLRYCAICKGELATYREAGEFVVRFLSSADPRSMTKSRWPKVAAFAIPVAAAFALFMVPIPRSAELPGSYEPSVIRISIPADAVLPPGAAPAGFEFVADIDVTPLP